MNPGYHHLENNLTVSKKVMLLHNFDVPLSILYPKDMKAHTVQKFDWKKIRMDTVWAPAINVPANLLESIPTYLSQGNG